MELSSRGWTPAKNSCPKRAHNHTLTSERTVLEPTALQTSLDLDNQTRDKMTKRTKSMF